jgi:hypothetical protein
VLVEAERVGDDGRGDLDDERVGRSALDENPVTSCRNWPPQSALT